MSWLTSGRWPCFRSIASKNSCTNYARPTFLFGGGRSVLNALSDSSSSATNAFWSPHASWSCGWFGRCGLSYDGWHSVSVRFVRTFGCSVVSVGLYAGTDVGIR